MTVFVTGAAGTTGSTLVRLFGARDVPVRAVVHTPENAPDWDDDVEEVTGTRATPPETSVGDHVDAFQSA